MQAGVVPSDPRQPWDVRSVLARLLDGSRFDEFKARHARAPYASTLTATHWCSKQICTASMAYAHTQQGGPYMLSRPSIMKPGPKAESCSDGWGQVRYHAGHGVWEHLRAARGHCGQQRRPLLRVRPQRCLGYRSCPPPLGSTEPSGAGAASCILRRLHVMVP